MNNTSGILIFNTDEECNNYIKACMGNKLVSDLQLASAATFIGVITLIGLGY